MPETDFGADIARYQIKEALMFFRDDTHPSTKCIHCVCGQSFASLDHPLLHDLKRLRLVSPWQVTIRQ